jgi:hypothetical protein
MSLKTDAEDIRDLADKIIQFEILRAKFVANGGQILAIPDNPDSAVTLTAPQRQALLAVEAGWQATIKSISAAW